MSDLAMTRSIVPISLLAGMLSATSFAAEFSPDSRVVDVTVYREGALVTRETKVTLPAGDHRIVLREIPSVADPNSVRISGVGTGGMTLGGVEITQDFRPVNLTSDYKSLEKELGDFIGQMSSLDDRQRSIISLREFLSSLKATAGQESSKDLLTRGFAVDSWQEAFQFLSDRLNDLAAEERSLAPKRKEFTEKIDVVRQELNQLASQGGIQRWTATVLISAPHGGEMTLKAMYLAQSASWIPLYDARLDPGSGKVEMIWQAQITQNTGEDWKDVGVTLSTTRPAAGIDLPKLTSISLVPIQVLYQKAKANAAQESISGLPVLGKDYQDVLTIAPGETDANGGAGSALLGARDTSVAGMQPLAPPPPAPLGMEEGRSGRRDVAVTFALPGKLDIPSDGQPHKHRVASRELGGKTEFHTIPRLIPAVFLVSEVTLSGEIPLLPGRVQLFVGPDLVGSSWMLDHAAGEEFALSFGPDDRLKAERKSVWRKVEQKGKDDETDYRFLTTLENHLGHDASLELKDRIPISGDERLTVILDEKNTNAGFTRDPNEPGILTWNVSIPKGSKKEIVLQYRVRAPRGLLIAGME
jgi:uncharacterized protein (TIGR02231 family)